MLCPGLPDGQLLRMMGELIVDSMSLSCICAVFLHIFSRRQLELLSSSYRFGGIAQ